MSSEPVGDFGLIGLAVMGQNLILNAADHGHTVVAFNRTVSKVDKFLENEAKGKSIVGAHSIKEFISKLKTPRRMMLLVMAGKPVDDFIELLLENGLEKGDIVIDGGNSHYPDTNRRTEYLKTKGIRFVGSGVSGGEEGARYGPSIMPGGNEEAWPYIKDILQDISAKSDGEACCQWVGDNGAGHYVKMVHNGIEYGDMQLISEAYDILKRGVGLSNKEIGDVFAEWNKGVLDSFLIEITRDVVSKGALWGIPTPAFSTALSFYDGYRTKDLPANMLQAQRDYFGAHTFRIKPEFASEKYPEGKDIHVNWTGRGGDVSASTYTA